MNVKIYTPAMSPDGSFRIDDVPAGNYDLGFTFESSSGRILAGLPPVVFDPWAPFTPLKIVVPSMPSGRSDEPVQIPDIQMQLSSPVDVGSLAPDFCVPTLDNKTVTLSSFRGKYVLLHFWSGTSVDSLDGFSDLKAVEAAYTQTGRLEIIDLTADKKDTALDYVRRHQLAWHHGWLEQGFGLPSKYVPQIPTTWLIGPDGKILAHPQPGDDISIVVGEAMKK